MPFWVSPCPCLFWSPFFGLQFPETRGDNAILPAENGKYVAFEFNTGAPVLAPDREGQITWVPPSSNEGQVLVAITECPGDFTNLPPGSAKLKMGGGHGGHNGLKDIIAHLGSRDFWRLRLGIGHPGERAEVSNFVLNNPRREERDAIDQAIERALDAAPLIIEGKQEAAMLKLHTA